MTPLYPYQSDAVAQIATGKPTYLGFDPGLGKSRTALEAARKRRADRILVVGPASSRYVWERECRQWWPGVAFRLCNSPGDLAMLKQDGITMITYGLLSLKESPFVSLIAKGAPFDMTILDEASAVKNPAANRTRAILGRMLPKLGYVLPLSGTPAPNNASELYPILKALYPSALAKATKPSETMLQWEFEDNFCKVAQKNFGGGRTVRVIEGNKNWPELRRRMTGFMLRVRKEDVLKDLPPIRWDTVPLPVAPGPSHFAIGTIPVGLSDDDLLKYLSGATGEEHVMRLRRILGIAKAQPAVEYIDDFLDTLPGNHKVVVFAHHKEVIAALDKGLQDWSPAVVVGASTPAERTASVNKFLTNPACRVFIGNIQAAGTALTLVGPMCKCSDVIFVEATYSVGDNVQAACRVHRIGQQDAVVARFLTAHGTIDDRIQAILARKAQDFEDLFN